MRQSTSRLTPEASPGAVDAFLQALEHPHKAGVQLLRTAILAIDPRIRDTVKWNAPSFMLDDHFATFRLQPAHRFQLILHTGAKATRPPRQFVLHGASSLVSWAAPDRCVVDIGSTEAAQRQRDQVMDCVQQWLRQLAPEH